MIDGDIDFFHVKKATDAVDQESQLSSVRSLKEQFISISNDIQNVISPFSVEYGVKINYKLSFGNIKTEIGDYIQKTNPDIIVLGKRKAAPLKLDRDSVSNFVLNMFKGPVLLVSDTNQLEPNKLLSLGILNSFEKSNNIDLVDNLVENIQKPLKSFSFVNRTNLNTCNTTSDNKMVEFVFEDGDNSISCLSKYISKNNINLLCLDRAFNKVSPKVKVNDAINKLNVSMLLTRSERLQVNKLY